MPILYLHGYASSPQSIKGVAFHRRWPEIELLDLRLPSLSAMIDMVLARVAERTVIIGSSLGGLTAARVAERDPRVVAVVLFAPAFQLAWRKLLGAEMNDFIADVEAIDRGYPDVRVPALVFHGRNDDVVPIEHSRTFARDRANVRLVELDDGHELVASLPVLLAETERFLAGLDH
jgi:pimeloyl-ACP methyl ester carboxylesterase